jgi:hypothetical protein
VWKNRGQLGLAAPSIAAEIPVLRSSWHVWVPDGFSFSEIESNLPVPEAPTEELLVRMLGRGALGVFALTLSVAKSSPRASARRKTLTEELRMIESAVDQFEIEAPAQPGRPKTQEAKSLDGEIPIARPATEAPLVLMKTAPAKPQGGNDGGQSSSTSQAKGYFDDGNK